MNSEQLVRAFGLAVALIGLLFVAVAVALVLSVWQHPCTFVAPP